MTRRLTGKIALVTGVFQVSQSLNGTRPIFVETRFRGIGAAISRNLAAQGATLLLNFNTNTAAAEQLLSELPVAHPPYSLIRGDVGSNSTLQLISSIVKELGGIDFVVLNAGIMPMIHLGNVTEENYTEMFNTNVKGPLLLVQELAPQIREEGEIILFSTSDMERVFSRDPSFTSRKITTNVISPDIAKPEDVAGLVSYLVTDGGRWVNDQNLRVNGGMV
ncbi:NAD(P)-binding protein [Atractiella rhizophila]|nr:NAD(P)-binding protein [Atractiella rhizophila]